MKSSSEERARHQDRVARLRSRLDEAGVVHLDNPSHIVPVMVCDPVLCKQISDVLIDRYGIYVQPINYPTVPRGAERLIWYRRWWRYGPKPCMWRKLFGMPLSLMSIVTWCSASGRQRPEIPVVVGAAHAGARIALDGMIEVGESQGIAEEKHWRVVTDNIPGCPLQCRTISSP